MGNYTHNQTDPWFWQRMTHTDVEEVLELTDSNFSQEIRDIFTPNRTRLAYNLHNAILQQSFNMNTHFISVARNHSDRKLVGWFWLERGKYMPFSNDECAVAEFSHVAMELPLRQRMRLVGQTIEQWVAWCELKNIPILISTSIREDQKGFMRLHEQFGFLIRGSFAYRKIGE
jgi:hypothetical protein